MSLLVNSGLPIPLPARLHPDISSRPPPAHHPSAPPPSPYTAHEMVEQSLLPPFPNPARQGPSPGPLSTGSGDKRQLPVAPHVPVPPPPPGRLPERGLARPTP